MSRTIRWIAAALILVSLTAGAAQAWPAAPSRPALAAPGGQNLFEVVWDWMTSWLRPTEPASAHRSRPGQQQKGGCTIDPDGKPICPS